MAKFASLKYSNLKNESRMKAFLDKFDNKQDFLSFDNKKVKIKKIQIGTEQYLPGNEELRSYLMTIPKLNATNIKLYNKAGGVLSFSKLAKVPEFGGQGAKKDGKISTGGRTTEVLSETGFCFYFAMSVNGHMDDYNIEAWRQVKNTSDFQTLCAKFRGVKKVLSYQFNDVKDMDNYLSKMYAFLTMEGWDQVIRRQVKKFRSKYPKVGSSYLIARPSALKSDISPYTAYNNISASLKGYIGLSSKVGPDKWNPADFWIFSRKGLKMIEQWNIKSKRLASIKAEMYSSSYMNLVNKQLFKLYKSNDVFPVSLKKSGMTVKIVEVNTGKDEIEQTVEYDDVLLAETNQDVQIFYTLKTYENKKLVSSKKLFAKMKTLAGGFRLELFEKGRDAQARHGSIGVGLQNYIIYNTDDSGIQVLDDIRQDYRDDDGMEVIPNRGSSEWMGVNKYAKMGKDAEKLLPYVNSMMEKINGVDSKFKDSKFAGQGNYGMAIATKAGAGEVAVAVTKIINKHARDIVIENLHLAAGSGGIQVGASPQQMKARARYLGMKEDELILVDSMKEYDALLGAGFHLKIL